MGKEAAARRPSRERSVRWFNCPDGCAHYAWLKNGIWALLDYLEKHKGLDVAWLVSECWKDTRARKDADYQFMAHLEYHIHTAYQQIVVMQEDGVANDCWIP